MEMKTPTLTDSPGKTRRTEENMEASRGAADTEPGLVDRRLKAYQDLKVERLKVASGLHRQTKVNLYLAKVTAGDTLGSPHTVYYELRIRHALFNFTTSLMPCA